MKIVEGIWLPDHEKHLVGMLHSSPKVDGKGTYQLHKLEGAMRYVRRKQCAVDVGMHVGLWSMHLVKLFDTVVGFEPVPEHIECLRKNMEGVDNYEIHEIALGHKEATVGMARLNGSSGSTYVDPDGTGTRMDKLDQYMFEAVDFLKIDVEGYEYFVVKGAEKTIRRFKPVIVIEQKPGKVGWFGHHQYDAKDLLKSWGAKEQFEIRGDFCLAWS